MKTMMIIGVGRGLAGALARRFGEAGWRVLLASRNVDSMNDLARAIAALGGEPHIFRCDAADMIAVDATVRAALARWHIDLLVYNAAFIRKATLVEQPLEMIASDLMVHAGGAFAAARAVLPEMAKRGSGTLLFSGGGLAVNPLPEYLSLGMGKAALRNLAEALYRDPAYAALQIAYVMIDAAVEGDTTRRIADLYWKLANDVADHRCWEIHYPKPAEVASDAIAGDRKAASEEGEALTPACRAAKTYLQCLNEYDGEKAVGLFAEKLDYRSPTGDYHTTGKEVADLLRVAFSGVVPPRKYKIANLVPIGEDGCLLQFDVFDTDTNRYVPIVVEHFKVDDEGKINYFRPYFQQIFDTSDLVKFDWPTSA